MRPSLDVKSREFKRRFDIRVAVVGQPNVGKSALFTALTKEIAHIANWPGTTVERKYGVVKHRGRKILLIDTPGVYGLTGTSPEEKVTKNFLLSRKYDVVLVLVDSTNIERTLYLAIHVLELTNKVVVALTKWDATHKEGIHIHVDKLEAKLGVPVVPVSSITGEGIRELLNAIVDVSTGRRRNKTFKLNYGQLEPSISEVERLISKCPYIPSVKRRWIAIRLLEGDPDLEDILAKHSPECIEKIGEIRQVISKSVGMGVDALIILTRYRFVDSVTSEVVVRTLKRPMLGSPLEKLFLRPKVGPLISLSIILGLYFLVFTLNTGFPLNLIFSFLGSEDLAEMIESMTIAGVLSSVFEAISSYIYTLNLPIWIKSMIADGIIGGVGSVLSFYPLIFMTLLVLGFLEDSGIGPYVAVSLHKFFSKFGLSGRAVYPTLIALGCNVPAVMASRASTEDYERRQIILSVPFIPCQARLVVITALAAALFPTPQEKILSIVIIYLIAMISYFVTSLLIRRAYGIKHSPELLLEVPPIHLPSPKVLWWITWDYSKHFLKKAGGIILILSLIIWFLTSYGPEGPAASIEETYAVIIGRMLAPIFAPLAVDPESSWKLAFTFLMGIVAKETFISSLALIAGEIDPASAIRKLGLTFPQSLAVMIMVTLYVPCIATIVTIYKEGGAKRAILSIILSLAVAYVIGLVAFYLASIFY